MDLLNPQLWLLGWRTLCMSLLVQCKV